MIFFNNISLSFGAKTIFNNILWTATEKSRTGLVGQRTGKTTLLRSSWTGGARWRHRGDCGQEEQDHRYLPQDLTELEDVALMITSSKGAA